MNTVIEQIYKLQKQYPYIETINLSRKVEYDFCSDYNLKLTLTAYPAEYDNYKLQIKFIGVADLKMGDVNNLFRIFFEIYDISDRQLENIKYSVKENEHNIFSFLCKDIEISHIHNE